MATVDYGWAKAKYLYNDLVHLTLDDDKYLNVNDTKKAEDISTLVCGENNDQANNIIIDFSDTKIINSEKLGTIIIGAYGFGKDSAKENKKEQPTVYINLDCKESDKLKKILNTTKISESDNVVLAENLNSAIGMYKLKKMNSK